ncbi:hypothetical protein GOBAR_DD33043 [Gossypium barbadense]|nr:hypothetical protein GOBAR_DD33043 [Gossypium barbadense]
MLETNHASSGGAIRDDHGRWKMGFTRKIGICSTVEVKLWGAYDGLRQAWHIGARNVILELNSLEVVHMLLSPMEGNKVAYALARHALGWRIGFYSFLQPLGYVLNLIHDDLEGLTKLE